MLEKKLEVFLHDRLKISGTLSEADQKNIFEERKKTGKRFIDLITRLDVQAQAEVLKLMSEFYQVPFLDLDHLQDVDRDALKLIPEKLIRYFKVFPVKKTKQDLTVAMVDPLDVVLVDRLSQYAKLEIVPGFAPEGAIQKAIDRALGPMDTLGKAIRTISGGEKGFEHTTPIDSGEAREDSSTPASTVHLVNLIVEKAVQSAASDIHLEPSEKSFYIRYRVDGVLHDYSPLPPKSMEASIISRLKIMASLDIAEKRLPQDGRIQFRIKDKEINLRISTFPTIYGENVVIRVLNRAESILSLEQIGFSEEVLTQFERLVVRPYGIILVTGPTGSGKTTTLYGALDKINTAERHIITLEDPVEYRMERIRQSQIDVKSGLTFARGLRSIMRQDPDVIMIGEIRDLETATIAIQAALTGHLVLSTLHTNDAPAAVTRLLDMGVEPFLISSSLTGVLAQRLVRILCQNCKQSYTPEKSLLERLGCANAKGPLHYSKKVGCEQCKETGFRGRIGVFELMIPDDEIRSLIVKKESAEVIRKTALEKGMKTLKDDGIRKAQAGLTTLEEVLRVTQEF